METDTKRTTKALLVLAAFLLLGGCDEFDMRRTDLCGIVP